MSKSSNRFRKLNPFKDRSPVHRRRASDYVLITLISFAVSVAGTRLLLEVTGYPQLGSGEIHIAHVLWGGMFLFIAALLPLIYLNEWILTISALTAGFGIGLFIDEVGKFITSSNDYFHPTAAPIVYVCFLLTVLLFALIRKRKKASARTEMYGILELFSEVLDRDLSGDEFNTLMGELNELIEGNDSKPLTELAESLKGYMEANRGRVVPHDPTVYDQIRNGIMKLEKRWLDRKRFRRVLIIGLLAWAAWALVSPIGYLLISHDAEQLQVFLDQLITNRLVRNASGLNWFEARIIIEGGMGVGSILAAILLILKAEKEAMWLGIVDLLITLNVVNLLIFYFDQFSTIILAAFQFVLFVMLIRYQRRFLLKKPGLEKTRA